MAGGRKQTTDNSAAIAAQFGISLKALRLYERLGMLNAPRNAAGWRVYGPAEIERLHGILSLKQLGLPLARIAELLKARSTDLAALLSVQEEMLLESRRETDHALTLIQIAKVRVGENGKLTAGELAALVRSISKTLIRSTAELEDLARRIYTPEQIAKFSRRGAEPGRCSPCRHAVGTDICGHQCDVARWRPAFEERSCDCASRSCAHPGANARRQGTVE